MDSSSKFDRTKFDLNQIDQIGQFDPLLIFDPQHLLKTAPHPAARLKRRSAGSRKQSQSDCQPLRAAI